MKTKIINEAILYLEGSIEDFIQVKDLLNSSTNQKDKTKYNEKLFDVMIDTKEYVKENSLYKIGLDNDDRLEKVNLDGMTKPIYFEKDIKYLVTKLKSKI